MSASIVVCLLVAICVCTAHLFIGFLLGQKGADNRRVVLAANEPIAFPQIEQITAELRERLADVVGLANHARALSEECSAAEPKLPIHIMRRVDSIAHGSSLLHENMATMTHLLPQRTDRLGTSQTPQTMHELSQREPARGGDTSHVSRFRYDVWQHVAPMHDGELPDAGEFRPAQCRDLSREGFSYFTEDLPAAEMLVVAMGSTPNLQFFTAKIVGSPPASRHGKVGYQIECEFVSKLAQAYEWDEVEGRIVHSSEGASEAKREADLQRSTNQPV